MGNRVWVVYLIRCSDESLYCGITNNLKKRLAAHNSGRGAKYTRSRQPIELIGVGPGMTKSDALKLEYRIKHLSAREKIIEFKKGEVNKMEKNLKMELQSVRKKMMALAKTVDKMIASVDRSEKSKPKTGKAQPKKKVVVKKSTTKKPAKLTASDTVLGIIRKSAASGRLNPAEWRASASSSLPTTHPTP